MRRHISRYDIVLWMLLVVTAVFLFVFTFLKPHRQADVVVVTVDGETYGTYGLDTPQEVSVEIQGTVTNVITIADHTATMTEADCPDHLCMKQGSISYDKENIVCLPNKVVVTVEAQESAEFDAVTN
jgi:hypothetical protein